MVTLKCPILNCAWQYESGFDAERSFLLISMHVEKDHAVPSNYAENQSPISSCKRRSKATVVSLARKQAPMPTEHIQCPKCKAPFRKFNGRNIRAFKQCMKCFRDEKKLRDNVLLRETDSGTKACTVSSSLLGIHDNSMVRDNIASDLCKLSRDHPRITLRLCPVGKTTFTTVIGIADTGAQSNVWGYQDFIMAGYVDDDLQKVSMKLSAANKQPLPIAGGFMANIEGNSPDGKIISCQEMIYVSQAVSGLFVSFNTLILLQIVNFRFPTIGGCQFQESVTADAQQIIGAVQTTSLHSTRQINSGCPETPCDCPQRSTVPLRPKELPFKPVPENIGRMKEWIIEYFKSSTFNTCPHKPLQEMNGPPIEIHMEPDAEPRVCKTPATISLHWQHRVEQDLKRDEALGILEKVPYGVPVTWCHRMVVTRKHDGTPRRTVDLSPLNRYCKREIHSGESPFRLARRIPSNTWKTTTDAWNGYHSVPLRKSDRHLTTFITPFGRYRYTRAPQGFLSSGDGYNRRFEEILEGFERKERCIDDTIFYDNELETHWWRTIDFLIRVGQSGIVLNLDKFQFCQKSVDFAGFCISSDRVEPLPKYLNAIKMFPTPQSATDIKSWFGLVNQLSSYAQLRDIMAPFRPFLSPKVAFRWNDELNQAFIASKEVIVDAIKHGVQIFDIGKPTCLRPDWPRKGIGFFLLQKHCTVIH